MSVDKHIEQFKNKNDYKKIKYILEEENLKISYPLIKENFEYICKLKKDGYNLYLLTNITEDSYNYLKKIMNVDEIFKGGIYSYQEHLIKPDEKIYEILVNKYNLNKKETLFFDDKEKNVNSAIKCGIKSFIFKTIDDIKNNL